MSFDPNKPFKVLDEPGEVSGFDPSKPFAKLDDISALSSAGRGSLQGATLNYADEISGAGEAALKVAFGDDKLSDLKENYKKYRDESRANFDNAEKANPGSYFAGEIGGGVATALIPGGIGAKLAGTTLKGAAALGGAYGLGSSKAELLEGEVGKAAADTAMGVAGGAAGHIAGKVIGKGVKKVAEAVKESKPAEWLVKKGANAVFDIPEKHTQKMLDDPNVVRKPISLLKVQEDTVSSVNRLRQTISMADDAAWEKLSDKPYFPGGDLKAFVDEELINKKLLQVNADDGKEFLSRIGKDKVAIAKAQEINDYLSASGTLSEKDIKGLIQKIDAEIDWDKTDMDTANHLLQSVRTRLDGVLKEGNPRYKETMQKVAPLVRLLDDSKREFRLKKGVEKGLDATDTTTSKLKSIKDSLGRDTKSGAKKILEDLSEFRSKPDHVSGAPTKWNKESMAKLNSLTEDLELLDLYDKTKGGVTAGSKNTNLLGVGGAAAGYIGSALNPVGGIAGAALGAGVGTIKDKYGRQMGGAVIPKIAGATKGTDKVVNQIAAKFSAMPKKYQTLLESASNRLGVSGMLVYHQQLLKIPEYSALFD